MALELCEVLTKYLRAQGPNDEEMGGIRGGQLHIIKHFT